MTVKFMLTLSEAFRWVEIGFCIALGLGTARLGWFLLLYIWEEIAVEREVRAYAKKHGIKA
jgi:hypothetical protein